MRSEILNFLQQEQQKPTADSSGLSFLFYTLNYITERIRHGKCSAEVSQRSELKMGLVGFFNLIMLFIQMCVSQKLDNKLEALFFFI